jgi:uncharacterized protein (DUF1015 family)
MHGMHLVVYLTVVFVVLVFCILLVFCSSIIFSLLRYLATQFLVLNQIVFAAQQAKRTLCNARTKQSCGSPFPSGAVFATSNGADLFCPIPLFFSVAFLLPCLQVIGPMQINPFRALLPHLEKIESNDAFFAAVKEEFHRFSQAAYFESGETPAIYLCSIQSAGHRALGIVACAHIQDYLQGAIKRHENTIPAKEEVQIRLWKEQQAMIKPVLLAYPSVPAIEAWMQKIATNQAPNLEIPFPAEEQTYQIWEIADPVELQYIQELFAAFVPRSYIADGHHRCSSSAVLYERGLIHGKADPDFLVALFPSSQLNIQAFHRVLDEVSWTADELIQKLEPYFHIESCASLVLPTQKFEWGLLVENRAFRLTWRSDFLKHYHWEKAILDTQLFNEVILPNVFGIVNVRQEPRLTYVEGVKGIAHLQQEQQRKPQRVAFALYPIDLQEMMLLADHNQALPPKSTWFEPRMKNGILVRPFPI